MKQNGTPPTAEAISALTDAQELYRIAKTVIPGGTQLLSKRPEMFLPDQWPSYYRQAHGCEVVGLDGRRYLDMSIMGILSCLLGYNDPDVTEAVVRRVQNGSMCTLNNPEEVELAQLLIELHPWAEKVRFGRCGGETMAVAVRIARAKTGRDLVAICGYHGWHDWYLSANLGERNLDGHLLPGLAPTGVPSQLAGTTLTFTYNRLDELEELVKRHGSDLAAIVMEPTRSHPPQPGFLEGVRDIASRCGAVFVIDEVSIGWRLALGGAHLKYGIEPDIAVFAKAMGNGHPSAAVVGRGDVMDAAQDSFISSTYWTEGVGSTAALAVIRKMQRIDVPAHIAHIGTMLREGMLGLAEKHGLPLTCTGHPPLPCFSFDHADNMALQTLYTRRMLDRDILANFAISVCLAHKEEHVQRYLEAAEEVFAELAQAIEKGDAAERIGGPVRHAGFARLA